MTETTADSTVDAVTAKLEWTVRLYDAEPGKRYGILVIATFAAAVGWMMFKQVLFPLIGFLAILGSTTEFWLPIRYVLDEKGASARCGISVSAIEWSDVKRVIVGEASAKLSPLEHDGRLSEFRGITLRYRDNQDEILEFVRKHVKEECLISGKKI